MIASLLLAAATLLVSDTVQATQQPFSPSPPAVFPTSPLNGSVIPTPFARLSWDATPFLDPAQWQTWDVRVQLSHSDTFQSSAVLIDDHVPGAVGRFVPTLQLEADTTYFWRVSVISNNYGGYGRPDKSPLSMQSNLHAGNVHWSSPLSFKVGTTPDDHHVIVPCHASIAQIHQLFWQASNLSTHAPSHVVTRVEFEPECIMQLDPRNQTQFISLSNVSNIVIDGKGAAITFTSFLTFVYLVDCNNISVHSFSFDFDPLPYTAILVQTATNSFFEGSLASGHPTLESNPAFSQVNIAELMDPAYPRVKRNSNDVINFGNWTRVPAAASSDEDTPRYHFSLPSQQDVEPGDAFVLDPRIYSGYDVEGGNDNTLFNITAYACSNECMTSEHAEGLAILACGLVLKPGRFLAANNGGHNHHSTRVAPWIADGIFENTGDDICHVSGLVMSAQAVVNDTTLLLTASAPDTYAHSHDNALGLAVGDTVGFWDFEHAKMLFRRKVLRLASGPDATTMTEFDGSVAGVVTGVISMSASEGDAQAQVENRSVDVGYNFNSSITQLFNLNRTANGFVFRNNVVRNGRRVGVLTKGRVGLVEGNVLTGLGGGGVELWNAPYEGLCGSFYTIRNNFINDTNQLDRYAAPIWTNAQAFDGDSFCHHDVVIFNNTIAAGPGSTFLLNNIEAVNILHNNIERCKTDPTATVNSTASRNISFDKHSNTVSLSSTAWLCSKP